jgi:hypothetical protein
MLVDESLVDGLKPIFTDYHGTLCVRTLILLTEQGPIFIYLFILWY